MATDKLIKNHMKRIAELQKLATATTLDGSTVAVSATLREQRAKTVTDALKRVRQQRADTLAQLDQEIGTLESELKALGYPTDVEVAMKRAGTSLKAMSKKRARTTPARKPKGGDKATKGKK